MVDMLCWDGKAPSAHMTFHVSEEDLIRLDVFDVQDRVISNFGDNPKKHIGVVKSEALTIVLVQYEVWFRTLNQQLWMASEDMELVSRRARRNQAL